MPPKVCFVQDDAVFQMNLDGSGVEPLAPPGPPVVEHCALSPSGRYVAVTAHPVSRDLAALFLFDRAQPGWRRLREDFAQVAPGGVDWFRDDTLGCAAQAVVDGPADLYRFALDGTIVQQLTHFVRDMSLTPPQPGVASDVSVARDGSILAYAWHVFVPIGTPGYQVYGEPPQVNGCVLHIEVWVINADGTGAHRVNDGGPLLGVSPDGIPIGAFDPTISRDKTRLVYSRTNVEVPPNQPWNTAHDLYISPLDGSASQRMTAPGPISIIPDWFDHVIVYTLFVNGGGQAVARCNDVQPEQPPTPIHPGGVAGKFARTPA